MYRLDKRGNQNTEINHRNIKYGQPINSRPSFWDKRKMKRNREINIFEAVIKIILTYGRILD
jgi:hypothetical protein